MDVAQALDAVGFAQAGADGAVDRQGSPEAPARLGIVVDPVADRAPSFQNGGLLGILPLFPKDAARLLQRRNSGLPVVRFLQVCVDFADGSQCLRQPQAVV